MAYKLLSALFLSFSHLLLGAEVKEDLPALNPEEIPALMTGSESLIGGVISPLSGFPSLKETDLIVKGAVDIEISRVYISPQVPCSFDTDPAWDEYHLYRYLQPRYRGWTVLPHQELLLVMASRGGYTARVTLPSGAQLDFRVTPKKTSFHTELTGDIYGISNLGPEGPSGRCDVRNTRLEISPGLQTIQVVIPEGRICHYARGYGGKWLLQKETLTHGKVILYTYQNAQLVKIEARDKSEKKTYASIEVSRSLDKTRQVFTSSTGQKAIYHYEARTKEATLSKKDKLKKGKLQFKYKTSVEPLLTHVESPWKKESLHYCPRFLLSSCDGASPFLCKHGGFALDETPLYKVDTLFLPGAMGQWEEAYHIDYHLPEAGKKGGMTSVIDADGVKTNNFYSPQLLLEAVHTYDPFQNLKVEKIYTWNNRQQLEAVTVYNGSKELYFKKSYRYDAFGNPTSETLMGDLTGDGTCQSITTLREFSQDGLHLLLKEEKEGLTHLYTYLPGTDLMTSYLVKARDIVLRGEFFSYDESLNLIEKRVEGDYEKRITRYRLKSQAPHLDRPEAIEEYYVEGGVEILLKKVEIAYDIYGYVSKETHYGAEGRYAYTLEKNHDERGNLLAETNPSGQKAYYTYDEKGRCTSTLNFSGRLLKEKAYSPSGLVLLEKETAEGESRLTQYTYDAKQRCIKKQGPFGEVISYVYDPLTSKPIEINEGLRTSKKAYDTLGRETCRTDGNGNVTLTCSSVHGLPVETTYQDGTKEYFRYTLEGRLDTCIDPEGLKTCYTYDALGRVLKKTYEDASGKELATESFTYNSFHCTSHTDKEGRTTFFTYDGAGRKIGESFFEKTTTYSYDFLGFLSEKKENEITTGFVRDLEGRLLEKRVEGLPQTFFSYDADGNVSCRTEYIQGNAAVTLLSHDPFGRLVEKVDPMGTPLKIKYDDHARTQTTFTSTKIFKESFDELGRLIKKEILSPLFERLSFEETRYDPEGRPLFQTANGHTVAFTYTPRGRLASTTTAYETPLAATTSLTYTPSGRLASKTMPDGTTIHYTYHPLGYLESISSENLKHYFTSNKEGELLSCTDGAVTLKRDYDVYGNVIKEDVGGLSMEKQYDLQGRITSISLPKNGSIAYEYTPLHMNQAKRYSSKGELLYSASYEYDTSGHLLKELHGSHAIEYSYDLLGRKTKISSPHFEEAYLYDLSGNLVRQGDAVYTYDALDQLTSDEEGSYTHDALFNRLSKNASPTEVNALNQLLRQGDTTCSYDLNGCLVTKQTEGVSWHFSYDPLLRLTEACSDSVKLVFTYDPLGRRFSTVTYQKSPSGWEETGYERYLTHGEQELGALNREGGFLQLYVPGPYSKPVAIELEGAPYLPCLDVQGSVRRLVDLHTTEPAAAYNYTPFGEPLLTEESTPFNPWRYRSKRLDPNTCLIDFGHRFYDPELGRWLSPDPAGFTDSLNLYQYVFNNPLQYVDLDGRFAIVIPLFQILFGAGELALIVTSLETLGCICMAAVICEGAYRLEQAINQKIDEHRENELKRKKEGGIDPSLPLDPFNDPDLEDVSHPKARKRGHYKFRNKKTGEEIEFDSAKPEKNGHGQHDHYHRPNPDSVNDHDAYLDENGNPVGDGSEESHLYHPEQVWWKK